jgi:hypothetical protein
LQLQRSLHAFLPLLLVLGACAKDEPATNADASVVRMDASMDATVALDAGQPDAAQPDAALPDAALPDAAQPDAELPDAEVPDSGEHPDAELPDSGEHPDAEVPDSGEHPDAEVPDSGEHPDAEVPDSGEHPDAEIPDSGEHPDAEIPDSGIEPDAGFACAPDETLCDLACLPTSTDPLHCGDCDTVCVEPANAIPTCEAGGCTGVCTAGFDDCDLDLALTGTNGCETNTNTSTTSCGACNAGCPIPTNATAASCGGGVCGIGACALGWDSCDNDPTNGCELDVTTSTASCGACGNACGVPANATSAACNLGTCDIGQCATGFDDCDGDVANGCEVELASNPTHCGVCGTACGATDTCTNGACVPVATATGESCVDPITILPGVNSVAWTASAADYIAAGSIPACVTVGTTSGPDVVMRYVATVTGQAELNVFDKPVNTRWVVLVSDAACGSLTPQLACISDWAPTEMTGAFPVVAGTTYYAYISDTTSGTPVLSNPFNLRITEIDCTSFRASVVSTAPVSGARTTSLSPTMVVTFDTPIARSGSVTFTGSMGTVQTFNLTTTTGIVWSSGDRTVTMTPSTPFLAGESVTVSFTGVTDTRCGAAVGDPGWTFEIVTPPCAPGVNGMVGNSVTLVSTGIGSFTEYFVVADQDPAGWIYSGGTSAMWRVPKTGAGPESMATVAGLTTTHFGYDALAVGPNVYSLDNGTSGVGALWRLTTDGGVTWALQDMATFPSTPGDDFRSLTQYGNRIYMMTHESTAGAATEIWSVDVTSATLPAPAVLEASIPNLECSGLAMDMDYYYTICDEGLDPVIRVHRLTGAVSVVTEDLDASATKNSVEAQDFNLDGQADYLYVQVSTERGYFVCAPTDASPYTDLHWTIGAGTTNYGLSYDPVNNVLWSIDDDTRELVRVQ